MRILILKSVAISWRVCAASLIICGCVTRDLEPIGPPLQFGDTSLSTDTETDWSTDTVSDLTADTITDSTETDTATPTESDPDTESATSSDTVPDTMTDTLSEDTAVSDTGEDTGTATEEDTGEETETIPEPGTDSNTGTDADTDTETDSVLDTATDTRPITKWVGSTTQNEIFPYDFFDLWDQVTPENAGKWGEIEQERDVMRWDTLDALYDEAASKKIPFKAHTLLWYRQQPGWLTSLSPEAQASEVEEWIDEFCSHYPDITLINVVAMPFHEPPPYSDALGGDGATGYDWLINVFEMARNYCPNAQLLMEEYNALVWQTHDVKTVAAILNQRGLLDGIGCVGNSLVGADSTGILANINSLASLGLPLYIAGLEITNAADQVQRSEMERIFPMLYEHPAIAGITFWGYVEGQTYTKDAFLRHTNGTPRPALTWLMGYLDSQR